MNYTEVQGILGEIEFGPELKGDLVMTSFPVEANKIQVRIMNLADLFDGDQPPQFVDLKSIYPMSSKIEEISLSGNMPIDKKTKAKWLSVDNSKKEGA